MTERRFIPTADEAQGLHVGSMTRLIRMVEKQPPNFRYDLELRGEWLYTDWTSGSARSATERQRSPFGVAGGQLWLAEVWGVASRPCPNRGWYDGIEYANEQAALEGHDLLTCHEVDVPDDVDLDELRGQWNSAESMPRWASSLVLDVTEVRVVRLDRVTEDDYFATGRKMPPLEDGSMIAVNYWWIAELKKIFPPPDGECWPRWNPWVVIATVAKVEETGQ